MTIITTEQAQKLLDEATPGPWRSDDAAVRLDDKSLIALVYGNGRGSFMSNNRLFAAAPDLARTVIALHAQLADAQAAVALVVERASPNDQAIQDLADYFWRVHPNEIGEQGYDHVSRGGKYDNPRAAWYADQIKALCRGAMTRALADADGLALVRELRADADRLNRWRAEEGEKIKRQAKALTDLTKHCQRIEAENAGLARKIGKVQRGDGDHSQIADLEAKVINQRNELANLRARDGRLAELAVERDTLAAANAVLEAKVAGLVDAVKPFDAVGGTLFSKNWNMSDIVFDGGPMRSDCLFFEDFLNLRAALATQEAGT